MPRTLSFAGLVLALLAIDAAPALAGPPWISIEHPAGPHHRDTRGALLLVHTYRHDTRLPSPVTGTAEGLLAGRRQSVTLQITPTSQVGGYAVRGEIPAEGVWILVLTMVDTLGGSSAPASALVALGAGREVTSVKVPYSLDRGWIVPRAATAGDVEEMLRMAGALAQAQDAVRTRTAESGSGGIPSAVLGLAVLLPLGLTYRMRRRRRSADRPNEDPRL